MVKIASSVGNCLFRALADQLDGDDKNHFEYRIQVCDYIEKHEDDFAPFVSDIDSSKFGDYIQKMRKNG